MHIEGIIYAPEVIIRKKRLSLSGFMLKMLGMGKKYHPTIVLSDIEIEAGKLTLIDVEIDEAEEIIQKEIAGKSREPLRLTD